MTDLRVPSATYRLQFYHGFRFITAQALVPYLHDLGISDLYASPFFKARKRSLHGYSVTNPMEINPELGSRVSFRALSRVLKSRGMGLLLDIVPNHMALSHENPWWLEVLEDGPSSPYAMFFDIDWHPSPRILEGKVLQPILGAPYAQVIEGQDIWLTLEEEGFCIHYYDHKFPIDPNSYGLILSHRLEALSQELGEGNPAVTSLQELITSVALLPPRTASSRKKLQERQRQKPLIKESLWFHYQNNPIIKKFLDENLALFNGKKGDPESFNLMDQLLRLQAYRLAWWRTAMELINYRRFFSVNDLIGLRVEDPQVFEASHGLLFSLIQIGKISGLRIDHIDGLFDPEGYLRRLQDRLAEVEKGPGAGVGKFYVVVEKILEAGESLPPHWPVAGTTGYDFLNWVNGLFVEPRGLEKLTRIYARFTHSHAALPELVYEKKKLVLETLFGGEVEALGHHLDILAEQDRQARDISRNELQSALREVIACLPHYRTYIRDFEVSPQDRACLEEGLAAAQRRHPLLNPLALDFVRRVLFLDFPPNLPEGHKNDWLHFIMRWQQFTGPIMAKGLEDTALYVYNPLVSLNEVGSSLQACSAEHFHRLNLDRLASWPHSLNATSTHDTKRSEDVRLRLHVLSEIPSEWEACLQRWSAWNQAKKRQVGGMAVPDPNEEYFFYQTLLGSWPLLAEEMPAWRERLKAYLVKAAREAKVHTRWIAANHEHENALVAFLEAVLEDSHPNEFLDGIKKVASRLSHYGALNSLSQVLLKIVSPGVPDFYQGTELWDFSLVDPDNRRPVDFHKRVQVLSELKKKESSGMGPLAHDLLKNWQSGGIKLFVTYKALNFRKAHQEIFLRGDYIPLATSGRRAKHVVALARRLSDAWVVAAAARFFTDLLSPGDISCRTETWRGTALTLPDGAPREFVNIFTGDTVKCHPDERPGSLALARLFQDLPLALLWGRAG